MVPASQGALAAAIKSHGTNGTFFLKAGVHNGNGVMQPKAGSVFVGEAGAILDGGNTTTRCFFHDPAVIPYSVTAPTATAGFWTTAPLPQTGLAEHFLARLRRLGTAWLRATDNLGSKPPGAKSNFWLAAPQATTPLENSIIFGKRAA